MAMHAAGPGIQGNCQTRLACLDANSGTRGWSPPLFRPKRGKERPPNRWAGKYNHEADAARLLAVAAGGGGLRAYPNCYLAICPYQPCSARQGLAS